MTMISKDNLSNVMDDFKNNIFKTNEKLKWNPFNNSIFKIYGRKIQNIPYDFNYGACVSYNGFIYFFGSANEGYMKTAYKYDTFHNKFTKLSDIPVNFYYRDAVAQCGDKIYLMVDYVTYVYDILTDTYTAIIQNPGSGGFIHHSISSTTNGFYVFGNDKNSENANKVYYFNAGTATFSLVNTLAEYFSETGIVTDVNNPNHIYLFGSRYTADNKNYYFLETTCMYDAKSNTISRLADMPYYFYTGTCVSIGDYIYIFGNGYTADDGSHPYSKLIYRYDCERNKYDRLEDLAYDAFDCTGCAGVNDNCFYVLGGMNDNARIGYKYLLDASFTSVFKESNASIYIDDGTIYTDKEVLDIKCPPGCVYTKYIDNELVETNAILYNFGITIYVKPKATLNGKKLDGSGWTYLDMSKYL